MAVPNGRSEARAWCVVTTVVLLAVVVTCLNGPNVCMVKQKYNITKRVKYRAPMSIRTYEWCFSMPPRCSKWSTEMRDLTRLETEERTAEVAVCCPGYKMKDVSCVPICPNGKTGHGCSEDCPQDKWGPNCVHECPGCDHGSCSPVTGQCVCEHGWQGESCSVSMPPTPSTTTMIEEILTTAKPTTKTTLQATVATQKATTISITERIEPSTTPLQVISTTTAKLTTTSTTTTTNSPTTIPPPTTTSSTLRTTRLTSVPTSTTVVYNNTTLTPPWTVQSNDLLKIPINYAIHTNYNRTETPIESSSDILPNMNSTVKKDVIKEEKKGMTASVNTTLAILPSITSTVATTSLVKLTINETPSKTESPKKPETTLKVTTTKTKPKEIWIRPTQRGESSFIEPKIKTNHDQSHNRYRNVTKNDEISEFTTPRTIIVSIIPTSVSYVTFKKIALTTASYMNQKNNSSSQQQETVTNKTEKAVTKQLTTQQVSTSMPFTIRILSTVLTKNMTPISTTVTPISLKNITNKKFYVFDETPSITTKLFPASKTTNSMPSTSTAANKKLNSSNTLTTSSSTNHKTTQRLKAYGTTRSSKSTSFTRQTTAGRNAVNETTFTSPKPTTTVRSKPVLFATKVIKYYQSEKQRNVTAKSEVVTPKLLDVTVKTTKYSAAKHSQKTNDTKKNVTKVSNKPNVITTAGPIEDETFHILTEPEHITAVMSDKGRDHSTVDLISVISIAGGVMMSVITVAVIIVMVERCKKPRYEEVRKINDIRMQVMIDNNDVPPPYVRSIFHTPLPDPPTSEKCHYQPISTLDRNLKQFMRPVVVQAISPIMLENFRGILECHYDHLPQRNYDNGTLSTRCSVTPSMACTEELCGERALSVTDYTIEALKCEAKLDVIDSTTSEPLYAEIPCWRPPSEHAIEVLNLNGEAVTEL